MRTIYVERMLPKMLAVKALSRWWPGVVWSPISSTVVADFPEPRLPGPRWLRLRNRMCGVCATDLSLLFVHVDPSVAPAALPGNQRFYLGHEVVSTVEATGEGVGHFSVGQRVIMDTRFIGAHCLSQEIEPICRYCARGEFGLCINASAGLGHTGIGGGWGDGYTAHETEVYPVPNDISDEQAMLTEPMSIGLHAVLRRPPPAGGQALVLGCGIIGLGVLQSILAVAPDCMVTVLARHAHQADAARRLGAAHVINSGDYQKIAQLAGAKFYQAPMNKGMLLGGFDVIYDCVGAARTVEDSLRWARAGGAVVVVGIDLAVHRLDLNPIWYQEVDLIGSLGHSVDEWHGQRRHTYDWVFELFRSGRFTTEGLVTHRFRFEDYKQAIAVSTSKRTAQPIKVAFDYRAEPALP